MDRPLSPSASSLESTTAHSFLEEDPYPSAPLNHPRRPGPLEDPGTLTNSALLNRLEALLRKKAQEVQLAGQLGQALLEQQGELELRIREIAQVSERYAAHVPPRDDDDPDRATTTTSDDGERAIGDETRLKLRELERDLVGYEGQNSHLYETVGRAAQEPVPTIEQLSAAPHVVDTTTRRRAPSLSSASTRPAATGLVVGESSTGPGGGGGDALSRRARNTTQHRNNDLELATDIGQSLLVEVRRLQALLQDKDEHLQTAVKDKDQFAIELDNALQARKSMEENVGKFLSLSLIPSLVSNVPISFELRTFPSS